MLTPADIGGSEIWSIESTIRAGMFPTELMGASGDSALYMIKGAPLKEPPHPSGTYDLYETRRTAEGWRTVRRLSPSGAEAVFPEAGGVSADHLYHFTGATRVAGLEGGTLAEEGRATYLGKPDGTFEYIGIGSKDVETRALGRYITPAGGHVIFSTTVLESSWCTGGEPCPAKQLEPDAPPTGTGAVYDRSVGGDTRVVSLLPNDVTPAAGEEAQYQGNSADGSTVAFKVAGTLYLRVNNLETKEVTSGPATYAGLSLNGSRLFYISSGNIKMFDVATGVTVQVNTSADAQIVNIADNGDRVYFVSPSLLDGADGVAGEPNLYVWKAEGETTNFVATLEPSDVSGLPALDTWTTNVVAPNPFGEEVGPGADPSRTSPDGRFIAFESDARLTPFDNAGHTAIYWYDAATEQLRCASCDPSGASPVADARLEQFNFLKAAVAVHNLTADGSRVFFESQEPLVARDVDGGNDVYEWALEPGGTPSLHLISAGDSAQYFIPNYPFIGFNGNPLEDDILFGVSPSGSDVAFSSRTPLLSSAGRAGVPVLYDARVDGGFAEPVAPECLEACQSGLPEPMLSSSASSRFRGNGNVRKHRCTHRRHKSAKRRCRRSHKHRARRMHQKGQEDGR